jgi:hypothetical protein
MPIRVGEADHWQLIQPSATKWTTMSSSVRKEDFTVDSNFYYVNVVKQ